MGKAGYAYAVSRSGDVIAHPDISLVLQRRNVAQLEQVKAAFQAPLSSTKGQGEVRQSLDGRKVFTSAAVISSLDWAVFIEQPVEEAYGPIYAAVLRTSGLLLLGLGMAVLAGLFVARRIVRPLGMLREGVERIGRGDLGSRLDLKTGDEIEVLADQFNSMATQLQESYAGLERKVEERTRDLAEALEQQTATAEILRVISSSPTDLQPVMDAVAENAARLCGATDAVIRRVQGNLMRRVAAYGPLAKPTPETLPITRSMVMGKAIIDRETIHIPDISTPEARAEFPETLAIAQRIDVRTFLARPLLREGVAIGCILIHRTEARPFPDKQIELLETFADQAVIAIENVRLFQELQARTRELSQSVEELKGLSEVSQAVSSTLDLETVLNTIVAHAVQLSGTDAGAIYEFDESTRIFELRATHGMSEEFAEAIREARIGLQRDGLVGRAAMDRGGRVPLSRGSLEGSPGATRSTARPASGGARGGARRPGRDGRGQTG